MSRVCIWFIHFFGVGLLSIITINNFVEICNAKFFSLWGMAARTPGVAARTPGEGIGRGVPVAVPKCQVSLSILLQDLWLRTVTVPSSLPAKRRKLKAPFGFAPGFAAEYQGLPDIFPKPPARPAQSPLLAGFRKRYLSLDRPAFLLLLLGIRVMPEI